MIRQSSFKYERDGRSHPIASILVKCDAEIQSPSAGFSFADEQLAI